MPDAHASRRSIFERIVCGVDGTSESLNAVRQAVRLQDGEGRLLLVHAADLAKAAQAGMAAVHAAKLVEEEAQAALADARALAPSATAKVVDGDPVRVLLGEAEAEHATLIAVGSHGRGRAAGLLVGSVASKLLRDAASSLLIAREPRDLEAWPQAVVVGVDGSTESAVAVDAAGLVAERFGVPVRALAATGDRVELDAARAAAPKLEEQPGRAVDLLAAASETADLVVVGSRGLHGLKALGSVSERIAHQAHGSVLVVRTGEP